MTTQEVTPQVPVKEAEKKLTITEKIMTPSSWGMIEWSVIILVLLVIIYVLFGDKIMKFIMPRKMEEVSIPMTTPPAISPGTPTAVRQLFRMF